ncbi:hypothetical protein GUJ93_ZPchr0010g7407 [Zizania palustris]|uniref:Uncharacterized protein n=1 Tax=Zizania palustris TaxID=103762 RepID=A0A8J5WG20_ZIZPA|nr:hypothetical protein GUJ93_ZPchr0010g7407 [Zizania palustris]
MAMESAYALGSTRICNHQRLLSQHVSSRNGEIEHYLDNGNIEETELSLREGVCLNYEVFARSSNSVSQFWTELNRVQFLASMTS